MATLAHGKRITRANVAQRSSKRGSSPGLPVPSPRLKVARQTSGLPTATSAKGSSDLVLGLNFSGLAAFERLFLRMPVRLRRAGNNMLDLLFYDVDTIPAATRRSLLRWSDPDGSILVVRPGNGNAREVSHFEHLEDFLAWAGLGKMRVAVIAGVGSSALGTAALAANVADALDLPVVGIVSGYGLADALAEGLVGWFLLRPSNQLRQVIDTCFAPLTPLLQKISADTQPNGDPRRLLAYVRGLPETDSLDRLLSLPKTPVAILVGHSKGNLSIATALDNLSQEEQQVLCPHLTVATFGALVHLPPSLAAVRQFIGTLDGFGLMNSTLPQPAVLVPWATHTLNTRWPFHLAVQEILEKVGAIRLDRAPTFEEVTQDLIESTRYVARVAADWMEVFAGVTTAFEGALEESVRSLQQAFELMGHGESPRR